jgi:hypothetical protein
MVDIQPLLACCSLNSMAPPVAEKLMRAQRQNLQRSQWNVGWISRNQSPFRSRRNFFLDLPFYRTQNGHSHANGRGKLVQTPDFSHYLDSNEGHVGGGDTWEQPTVLELLTS